VLLRSEVHGTEVEEVGVRVVAVDLKDFRNEATTGSSLDVDDDIERIGDVCFDGTVR
jgi:hypothetical protein